MHAFWVVFENGHKGCVEADSAESAATIGGEVVGFKATSVKRLPHPADPRINKHIDPKYGVTPSFCFKPEQCCGNTACPQRYSCTE